MITRWVITRWKALRENPDRGSAVTSYFVVMAVGIMLFIGLAVDGGAQVQAGVRAERVATEAARAGLQAASPGRDTDPSAVTAAAERYLAAANTDGNLQGSARVDGTHLNVTVTVTTKTTFLGLLSVNQLTAHGTGRADLVRSVDGEG
jgi:hypothetical protein